MAFFVSLFPGLLVAYLCWRLPEPSRGTADRAHVTHSDEMELADEDGPPLFPHGFGHFVGDMVDGLRKDVGTILRIPTMRYALVGVSTVGFVVTAVATWMPTFYQNQLHLSQQASNGTFGALAILGGIPGTLIGGRIADRWVNRVLGARVVIPAVCIVISAGTLHGVVHPDGLRPGVRDPTARVPGRHRLRARAAGRAVRRGTGPRPRGRVRRLQPGLGRLRRRRRHRSSPRPSPASSATTTARRS